MSSVDPDMNIIKGTKTQRSNSKAKKKPSQKSVSNLLSSHPTAQGLPQAAQPAGTMLSNSNTLTAVASGTTMRGKRSSITHHPAA
jgi:hypothetical protein